MGGAPLGAAQRPLLDADGAVRFVVHHVEDVTDEVQRGAAHQRLRGEYAESESARHALEEANARLSEQQLELMNQQLQDQAVELQQQADELQATVAQLEERTEDAERDRDRVAQSEAKYRALFESIDEGFAVIELVVDDDGVPTDYRFVEANPAFVQQTGPSTPSGRRSASSSRTSRWTGSSATAASPPRASQPGSRASRG